MNAPPPLSTPLTRWADRAPGTRWPLIAVVMVVLVLAAASVAPPL